MCFGADETTYTMGAGSRVNKADAKADTLVAWPYPETIPGETSSQERVTGPSYRVQNSSTPALAAWLDKKERLVGKRSTTYVTRTTGHRVRRRSGKPDKSHKAAFGKTQRLPPTIPLEAGSDGNDNRITNQLEMRGRTWWVMPSFTRGSFSFPYVPSPLVAFEHSGGMVII